MFRSKTNAPHRLLTALLNSYYLCLQFWYPHEQCCTILRSKAWVQICYSSTPIQRGIYTNTDFPILAYFCDAEKSNANLLRLSTVMMGGERYWGSIAIRGDGYGPQGWGGRRGRITGFGSSGRGRGIQRAGGKQLIHDEPACGVVGGEWAAVKAGDFNTMILASP